MSSLGDYQKFPAGIDKLRLTVPELSLITDEDAKRQVCFSGYKASSIDEQSIASKWRIGGFDF